MAWTAHYAGILAKLYRNTGTIGTPTYSHITVCGELGMPLEWDAEDASVRGGGQLKRMEPTLLNAPIEFECLDVITDTNVVALKSAFFAGTSVLLALSSGTITDSGETIMTTDFKVLKAETKPAKGGLSMISFRAVPCYGSNALTVSTVA